MAPTQGEGTKVGMSKGKAILQLVSAVIFWPSAIYLGILYGWKLPVLVVLMILGCFMSQAASKEL